MAFHEIRKPIVRLKQLFPLILSSMLIVAAANVLLETPIHAAGTIGLSLGSGPVSSSVSVSGNGYSNSASFTVTFAGTLITSGTTSSTGDLSASFSVPLKPRGSYNVAVSDGTNTNTTTITLTVSNN